MADRKDSAILRLSPETRKELKILRDKLDCKSYDELLLHLMDYYDEKQEEK